MEFSLRWIGDYVDLSDDLTAAADEAARLLTGAGLSVDSIEPVGLGDGSRDVILEIEVTTNRPDAMNHLGLARELAVLSGRELKPPRALGDETAETRDSEAPPSEQAADVIRVSIEDFTLCPRYTAVVIRGVAVAPSPAWLQARLEALGLRSINNIVDVTNYVLWETGQPLHAFDLDKIGDAEIRVRRARPGEKLTTLDDLERELDPEILVIADAKEAVALGGVMGGLDSEVTDVTRHVLLEAAHFEPTTVRRGANKLDLHTDACHRFERGADPEACRWAAERAAALMVELAGGEILPGIAEAKKLPDAWPPRLELEVERLCRFSGVEIPTAEVERILNGLGFGTETLTEGHFRVTVPSWRYYDFTNAYPADLYEEVLRIYGFDRVPSTLPQLAGSDAPERPEIRRRRQAQDRLAAGGFTEAIDYAFHGRDDDEAYPNLLSESEALELDNPLSELYTVMRRSLLPNLVESARYNQRRGASAVRLFEIGHVFAKATRGGSETHRELETLALVLGGELGTPWERPVKLDFFDLKGAVEDLADELGVALEFEPAERSMLVPGTVAEVRRARSSENGGGERGEGEIVGHLGQLDDDDLLYPLFVAELLLGAFEGEVTDLEIEIPSRHPGIVIDTTLTHSLDVPWSALARAIEELVAEDLVDFGLKDRYEGKGVPRGGVNTTLTFLYNSPQRSLTQEEVNRRHAGLTAELERRFAFTQ